MTSQGFEKTKQFANQLAKWDKRIVEITIVKDVENREGEKGMNLICKFEPEPENDSTGFFWIANLLTRMELEGLHNQLNNEASLELGFTIGNEVFLPNGKTFNDKGEHIILWANHEE
jgi:hypothetical protein